MIESIEQRFRELAAFDSASTKESKVAAYNQHLLAKWKFKVKVDEMGNVVGYLAGEGEPILLNAHIDGVPPAKGHSPVKEGDVLKSDGTTNLRADDIAGNTIILEAIGNIIANKKKHPPLVVALTVQEEIGLLGAKAVEVENDVTQGIVYDNAFEACTVVSRGAAYIAFDVEVKGKETHPGIDLSQGINAIQVLIDTGIRLGEVDDGKSRLNIGTVIGGAARNVVPGNVKVQGEYRSFLQNEEVTAKMKDLKTMFTRAGDTVGAGKLYSFLRRVFDEWFISVVHHKR
jgi:tripeptide aminopeptidase